MSEQRSHHSYSPSTLPSLEACPCYRGRESTHERTIAGTRAHAVTESRIDDNRLDDEDAVAAAECLDFYERRKQLMEEARLHDISYLVPGLQAISAAIAENVPKNSEQDEALIESRFPKLIELQETYLSVDDEVFNDDYVDPVTKKRVIERVNSTTAGYADWSIVSHDRKYAEMGDWKFGKWPVESAEHNLQGIAYALGLFKAHPEIQHIKFWFKQPHLDSVSDADFFRHNIAQLYLRVQTVVARARAARHAGDFATASPAVPACNFCANIGICPKVAEFACKVGSKFHPLEIPSDITPSAIHTNRDTELGLRLANVMAIWSEAFRRQTTDRILRGDADIPAGHRIESRSNREIVDGTKFKEVSLKFVTPAEYDSLLDPPGFGVIEDLIKTKAPRMQKKAALESFKTTLESSGAVVKGRPYCFLKAVAETSNTTNKQ